MSKISLFCMSRGNKQQRTDARKRIQAWKQRSVSFVMRRASSMTNLLDKPLMHSSNDISAKASFDRKPGPGRSHRYCCESVPEGGRGSWRRDFYIGKERHGRLPPEYVNSWKAFEMEMIWKCCRRMPSSTWISNELRSTADHTLGRRTGEHVLAL
jgi:hypothetical protein